MLYTVYQVQATNGGILAGQARMLTANVVSEDGDFVSFKRPNGDEGRTLAARFWAEWHQSPAEAIDAAHRLYTEGMRRAGRDILEFGQRLAALAKLQENNVAYEIAREIHEALAARVTEFSQEALVNQPMAEICRRGLELAGWLKEQAAILAHVKGSQARSYAWAAEAIETHCGDEATPNTNQWLVDLIVEELLQTEVPE